MINKKNSLTFFLAFSVLMHLIAAYYSVGFHHPDEHFQILEFANYKLGNIDSNMLAWEFDAQIRPSLQPIISMGIIKSCAFFTTSPFTQAFVLRLIASLASLLSVFHFVKHLPENKLPYWSKFSLYFFSFCLWYLPFVHARFSSETGASVFMLLALVQFFKFDVSKKFIHALLAGVFWGLAFEFRYQTGIMILFYGLWLLIYRFNDFKIHLLQALGFLFVIGVSLLLDYYFYGSIVFPPYNYFTENIVNDVASSFGTAPWHFYYLMTMRRLFLPISLLHIAAFLYLIIYRRNHLLFWLIVPFVIIHSMIPHKETRFLFPLLFISPYAVCLVIHAFKEKFRQFSSRFSELKILWVLWVTMLPLTIWKSIYPANNYINVIHYITDNYKEINLLYLHDIKPNTLLQLSFYDPEEIINSEHVLITNLEENQSLKTKDLYMVLTRDKMLELQKTHAINFSLIKDFAPPFYDLLTPMDFLKIDTPEKLYRATLVN